MFFVKMSMLFVPLLYIFQPKCEPYWSDTEPMTIEQFTITVIAKEERTDFVFRKLFVTMKQVGVYKNIYRKKNTTILWRHGYQIIAP